jgi:hypothetical protein
VSVREVNERYLLQVIEEVERHHPGYKRRGLNNHHWWRPVSPVQPCERCGTRVFLLEDQCGARTWSQVGPVDGEGANMGAQLSPHTSEVCRKARDANGVIDLAELLAEQR